MVTRQPPSKWFDKIIKKKKYETAAMAPYNTCTDRIPFPTRPYTRNILNGKALYLPKMS